MQEKIRKINFLTWSIFDEVTNGSLATISSKIASTSDLQAKKQEYSELM